MRRNVSRRLRLKMKSEQTASSARKRTAIEFFGCIVGATALRLDGPEPFPPPFELPKSKLIGEKLRLAAGVAGGVVCKPWVVVV